MIDSNLCMTCNDSISDPVCRSCYINQIEILLHDLKISSIANEIILRKIKNKFPLETLNSTLCILCKKENVALCRYCFSIFLVGMLRDLNFTEELIDSFGYNMVYDENNFKDREG